MSNGLTLPFNEAFKSDTGTAFAIIVRPSSFDKGGDAVYGECNGAGSGVAGVSANGSAVSGSCESGPGPGVSGNCGLLVSKPRVEGAGVAGAGSDYGVWGGCTGNPGGYGVWGSSDSGVGVYGASTSNDAINGTSNSSAHAAVAAHNNGGGFGVWAQGRVAGSFTAASNPKNDGNGLSVVDPNNEDALVSVSNAAGYAAVAAHNYGGGFGLYGTSDRPGGTGIYAQGASKAAQFDGAVHVNGDILVTGDMVLVNSSGDVAEDFDVEAEPLNAEPGTVLIINESGNLCASDAPYDTRVAGVVAGAGELKPALVLQRLPSHKPRSPIALVGKAFCKVDATFGKVIAGDLLTTSVTPGHAMKASDRSQALGAVIGKALAGLDGGLGLIPILVSPR